MNSRLALDVATYINTHKQDTPYADLEAYANFAPDNKADYIAVFDTGGYAPERYYGTSAPHDRQTVQVIIRRTSPTAAYTAATALYHDLDGLYAVTMNNTSYLSLEAVNPPNNMGVVNVSTKGQAHSYTLNLYGRKVRS